MHDGTQNRAAFLHWGWYASGVFVVALTVRLAALWLAGRDLAFLKYPQAARMIAAGTLGGERVLDFSPLYLELHRLALWVGATDLDLLRSVQCGVGAVSCVVIFGLGWNLLGCACGVAAGLLAALSGDLVAYDQVFEPEPVLVFCAVAGFWLLCRRAPRRPWLFHVLAGLLLGLAVATRPSAVLLLPVALATSVVRRWSAPWRARLVPLALLLGAFAAVQIGFGVRDRAYSVSPAMSPWQVFYTGNNPMATGLWRSDFIMSELQAETRGLGPDHGHQMFRDLARAARPAAAEPDRYWRDLSLAFIRSYPGRFVELLVAKVLALGQAHDPHDIISVYRLHERLRYWPLIGASVLVPLGIAGVLVLRRGLWFVGLAGLAQASVCVLFLVSARHRLQLLPWICVGAAATVVYATRWASSLLRGRRERGPQAVATRTALALLLGSAALWAVFHLPLPPGHFARRSAQLARRSLDALRAAGRLQRRNRLRAAAVQLSRAFYVMPWRYQQQSISRVPFPLRALARGQLAAAREARDRGEPLALLRCGYLLEMAGRAEEAVSVFEQIEAQRRWPGDAQLRFKAALRAGRALLASRHPARASRAFARAAALRPGAVEALVGIAVAADDEAALEEAFRVNSGFEVLYFQGRLLLVAGRPRRAKAPLARLVQALPRYARGRMLYAIALHRAGELDEAVAQVVRAQKRHPALFDPDFRPIALLREAASRAPQQPQRWRRLATFAELYGERSVAVAAWRRLARLRPLAPRELVRLGWLHLRHEEPRRAIPYLARAVQLSPRVAHGKAGLALARERAAAAR